MSYPKYPAYKDSGVEWLGEVPKGWDIANIKLFAELITGITPPSSDLSNYTKEGWPWIRPEDLDNSGDAVLASRFLTDKGWRFCRTVKSKSTLICCIGSIGKLGFVESNVTTNQQITAVVPKRNERFFFYLMHTLKPAFNINATGNVLRILNSERLGNIAITIPSQNEAETIARFLDHETTRIDALIEEQQRLIELLQEKRQAVISHAVTKGLDPTVPMKDSGVEWLGEVPAHWTVGGVTHFIGPVVDYRGRTPTKVDDGIFLVTARNIRNGQIDYEVSKEYVEPESAESLLARGRPEIGDLLFTMEAPLGQVALIDRTDIALAQRIVKFRGKPDVMNNHYLMFWFMSTACQARLETLATGSTALGIKASKLGMIECLVPPLKEQDAIVSHLQKETAKSDTLINEAEQVTLLLQERRSALISAAVTGKIDVRDWQPPTPSKTHDVEEAEAV
ncbi:restriction endonuclease subunit S [Lujinxingia vulgaris]|uniref:Restriction endonuclease subunit S n=1 Tax=Lujinxingia vulgaris TaxID=2600176 RepID=A0A5C6X905_9DELT|nr:restriction endonuclease subunit S [Lujinxingia vulgaris]TXD35191.1 restriction endonuclease subunit S [Lujinxingia vulgaris]